MQRTNTMWRAVWFPYLSYVSLFLGMGLISGSIVHMPISPGRYSIIMVAGIVLFGFASFVNELKGQEEMSQLAVARSLVFSLFLSVGIGMMSGGVQHFTDNPTYAALLIPGGFGLSLFSFVLKHRIPLTVKKAYLLIALFLVMVLPMRATLNYVAQNVAVGDGHGGH